MSEMQGIVNRMADGDVSAIIAGVTSNADILIMNAFIFGTRLGIKNDAFVEKLKSAKESDVVLIGTPLSSVAIAALDVLEIEEYTGKDTRIKGLIESRFIW